VDAPDVPAPDEGMKRVMVDLSVVVQMALAGLLGAGVLLTYWTLAYWISGYRTSPRFEGLQWDGWMLFAVLGAGLVLLASGVALSLSWLMRRERWIEFGLWSAASIVLLGLAAASTIAISIR
jgi:hypothetical protein